jgi:hypothetical protein
MKTMILILSFGFLLACKPVKTTFDNELKTHFAPLAKQADTLRADDIAHLPKPVQRYLQYCGYVGKPIPMNAEVVWEESFIKMKPDRKWMRLKTIQFNQVEPLFRIAYMRANVAGFIPFDGRDLYHEGRGHMYGKIAGSLTVFDEKAAEIAKSALVIVLAEALLVPGIALSQNLSWEPVDALTARARIAHKGHVAEGVFHFSESGELIRFHTEGRYYMHPEKGNILMPFTASIGSYREQNGYRIPTHMMATWHLGNRDYDYWKGTIKTVRYNI